MIFVEGESDFGCCSEVAVEVRANLVIKELAYLRTLYLYGENMNKAKRSRRGYEDVERGWGLRAEILCV